MKAVWNDQIVAEAKKDELIRIEGNWYFAPKALRSDFFTKTDTHTTCFWKGEASYYTITVDGEENTDAAWFYPAPMEGSVERVGKDFTDYVAFWHGVEISE